MRGIGYTRLMDKKNILLLFGGESSEYEVSLRSAQNIYEAIDSSRYAVTLCNISKSGIWKIVDSVRDATPNDNTIQLDLGHGRFFSDGRFLNVDVVFPVLHGKFGEDGTVQGLLDLVGVAYVGCGTESSALCMDKLRTKRLLKSAGIAVVPDAVVDGALEQGDYSSLVAQLPGPWFVKPCRAGSSVGVAKVKNVADLDVAVQAALVHDSEVLIESAVQNPRELEVAVLGNTPDIIASGVGEIIPGEEYYSYEDKYAETSTSKVIEHANLPDELGERIPAIAKQVYQTLNCRGLARVDFLLSDSGELFVNEVNTMPGFTSISMFPKLMMHTGYTYPQLIDKLIELALQ